MESLGAGEKEKRKNYDNALHLVIRDVEVEVVVLVALHDELVDLDDVGEGFGGCEHAEEPCAKDVSCTSSPFRSTCESSKTLFNPLFSWAAFAWLISSSDDKKGESHDYNGNF